MIAGPSSETGAAAPPEIQRPKSLQKTGPRPPETPSSPPGDTPAAPAPEAPAAPAPTAPVSAPPPDPPRDPPRAPPPPGTLESTGDNAQAPSLPAAAGEPEASSEAASPEPPARGTRRERRGDRSWRERERDPTRPFTHRGIVLEGKIGTLGCFRRHCRTETNHGARPGLRLGGFLGGNILGFLDLGLEGSWGRVRPQAYSGRNAIDLYNLDPNALAAAIAEELGVPALPLDLSGLAVAGVTSTAIRGGPTLRVHLVPRGRLAAYVGVGVHYLLWRNDYVTADSAFRLAFHGLSVPISAGVGYYVLRHLNLNAEFTYTHPAWLAASIRHPDLNFIAPLFLLEGAALRAGSDLQRELPSFWSVVLSARLRF